ncbi:MAG: tripartite tricarboxylate transporter substrate-binding protein [Hyphomicrobium aestuarii]|nr:tripartite tricarboxylate transporter substrate-binding protein [Hyphomicrobium aestuarii]
MVKTARSVARATAAVMAVVVFLAAGLSTASAQWVPTKPVDFIVMAGKGGGADQATRFLISVIEKNNLAPVKFEVVNMPADSGAEALATLKKRAGDPHVLMFTLNSFYTTPLERPQIAVDIAQFSPVARMAEDVFALWVHSDRNDIVTIEDFVKAAKAKGKAWIMAGTGKGAEDNLLTDFLNAQYGLEMTYQSYGGGGEVAKLLAEKKADSTVNNPSEQKEFFPKGVTKPILTFTPGRLSLYPAQPTLRETGMDFIYKMQRSVVGAPGLKSEQAAYWQALFRTLHASPEWKKYAADNSLAGDFLTGPNLTSYWVAEREKHLRWKTALDLMRP